MNNLSFANKYRPRVFEDVLGQEATVEALKGKLKDGRLPRTSLYCGSHGSGKTTLARIVAKAVNCLDPQENGNPCCQCDSCRSIDAGASPDVIELDAASHNKVEDAEKIIKQVEFLPLGNKKVIILDECHMMTKEAQNKLLKIVEDPPSHALFIFCTTEDNRVLPTILSRCNRFDFRPVPDSDIYRNLKKVCDCEQLKYEEDALRLIVKSSNGHVRDSLSILEQLSGDSLTEKRVSKVLGLATNDQILKILEAVLAQDIQYCFSMLEKIICGGNITAFLKAVVETLCYMVTFDENVEDGETARFRGYCRKLKEYPYFLTPSRCLRFISIITGTLRDNKGLGLDLAAKLCFLSMTVEEEKNDRISALEEEIRILKEQISNTGTGKETAAMQETRTREKINTTGNESLTGSDSCAGNDILPVQDIEEDPFPFGEALKPVPLGTMSETGDGMPVPPAQHTIISIPGGTVHPKGETTGKEVSEMNGQTVSPAEFDEIGSFGSGLFGPACARRF